MMISLRCIWFETVATDFETAALEARDRRSLNDHCSDLRSVTIHLQNYGPTSETLKHSHMRCNDFWIESCFRVHSSKISKQVSKCLFQNVYFISSMVHIYNLT